MLKRFEASICKESTFKEFVKLVLWEILLSNELILVPKILIKLFVDSEAKFSLPAVARIFELVVLCVANLRLRIFKIAAKAGSKEKLKIK